MPPSNHGDLSKLSPHELLGLARYVLDRPRQIEVRRCLGAGIVWLIIGFILLSVGGLCLANPGRYIPVLVLGVGLLLWGLCNLIRGLIFALDRSPVLTLDVEMLIDHRTDRRYPWSAIRKASLARTTENGRETSATLTLMLSELLVEREVRIDVANLDYSACGIFRIVGQRANLHQAERDSPLARA
jgi:hypothetical protein